MFINNLIKVLLVVVPLSVSQKVFSEDFFITEDSAMKKVVVEAGDSLTIDGATFTGKIRVEGGSLLLTNSAVVVGNILVDSQGEFQSNLFSSVLGKVRIIDANIVHVDSLTVSDAFRVIKADLVGLVYSSFAGVVKVEEVSNLNVFGSEFADLVRISQVRYPYIQSSSFSGDLKLQESGDSTLIANTVLGGLRVSGNTGVLLVHSHNVTQGVKITESDIVAVANNTVGGWVRLIDNMETHALDNIIEGNLRIFPSSLICEDDGNIVGGVRKGGCA